MTTGFPRQQYLCPRADGMVPVISIGKRKVIGRSSCLLVCILVEPGKAPHLWCSFTKTKKRFDGDSTRLRRR